MKPCIHAGPQVPPLAKGDLSTSILDLMYDIKKTYFYKANRGSDFMIQSLRYKDILSAVESFVRNALAIQVIDDSDPDNGGFRCPEHLVCETWSAVNTFNTMAVLFCNPHSQYYHSPGLLQRMRLALSFIVRSQNEEGTINTYFSGEISSISNLPFIMNTLIKSYRLLFRENVDRNMLNTIEIFLRKGVNAIKTKPLQGELQRLAGASALIDFDKIFLDHSALIKAENFLSNMVNINNDGLYTDNSPTYNMLFNLNLINIAKKMNRPYLMEFVRKNLNFSLYNFHPNGEVVTEYSNLHRIESGLPHGYCVWKEMSIIDHNGYYASAGDLVLDVFLSNMENGFCRYYINDPNFSPNGRLLSKFFVTSNIGELLLAEEEFDNHAINRLPLPCRFERFFSNSNIVRFRDGKMSATIMGNNNILFAIRSNQVIIDGFRLRFFYKNFHNFGPPKIEASPKSYLLKDSYTYNKLISNNLPLQTEVNELEIITEISHKSTGFDIDICATGRKGIPLLLEFGVRKQGTLISDGMEYDLRNIDLHYIDSKEIIIKNGDDCINIRGGIVQHKIYDHDNRWTKNLFTTSLLITPLTPYYDKIQIIYS